jgi:ribonuclease G
MEPESLRHDLHFLSGLWENILNLYNKEKAPALLYRDVTLLFRTVRDLFNDYISEFHIDNAQEYHKIKDLLHCISPALSERVSLYRNTLPIFEYFCIESEIERSLNRVIWLNCGGYLVFDDTEALTVIDVNTGKYTGKSNLEDTIFKTNLEAAEEIARQIRLRDIGGIIIVDFIDMSSAENRQRILEKLKEKMHNDRTKSHVLGITSLGLVEIARKKVRQGLAAVLQQPCSPRKP